MQSSQACEPERLVSTLRRESLGQCSGICSLGNVPGWARSSRQGLITCPEPKGFDQGEFLGLLGGSCPGLVGPWGP